MAAALVTTAIACANDFPEDGRTVTPAGSQHTAAPTQPTPTPRQDATPTATAPVEQSRPEPTPRDNPSPEPTPTPRLDVTPTATALAEEPRPEPTVRGGPPPRIFEIDWSTDKSSIAPGDPVTITLELRNVWDKPVVISEFPAATTLTHMDTRIEVSVPLEVEGVDGLPDHLNPDETLIVNAAVSPSLSAGLQSGRYRIRGFQVSYSKGVPDGAWARMGMSSEELFVVIPPEGVLDNTLEVEKAVEGDHVRITLKSIRFTPERATILAFAESLAGDPVKPQPTVAGTPTSAMPLGATPTPTSVIAQVPRDFDTTELTAFFRLDGGEWRLLTDHAYRETPIGAHHEWSFSPVPANAKTLEFAIVPGNQPGRDGTFTYPTDDASSWEWFVPLQGKKQD